jgi:hypothetical protein
VVREMARSIWIKLLCIASFASVAATLAASSNGDELQPTVPANPRRGTADVPSWLSGAWTREWIEHRGVRSTTLDVHYLQASTLFGDVRIPFDRPAFPHAASFADLTDQELRMLAQQEGFSGHTTMDGAIATWHRHIDFQPPDGTDDVGRLELITHDRMYEHALDSSYVESWQLLTSGKGRFLVVRTERLGRPQRVLIVVGDYFLFVRNRAHDLPVAESLDALIEATGASRARVIEYLDCEFSTGRVRKGSMPWEIQHSTLPWREGHRIDFVDEIASFLNANGFAPPTLGEERWIVPVNTFAPPELAALFGLKRRP